MSQHLQTHVQPARSVPSEMLQRQCACVGSRERDCESCRNKRLTAQRSLSGRTPIEHPDRGLSHFAAGSDIGHDFSRVRIAPGIQKELVIGEPGDRYEREADRASKALTEDLAHPPGSRTRRTSLADSLSPVVSRQASVSEGSAYDTTAIEAQMESARSNGSPLPAPSKNLMEPFFGHDFSRVRVHTDRSSRQMNRMLNARAFTVGRDIFFGEEGFQPDTLPGKALLAHELSHTVQQASLSGVQRIQRDDFRPAPGQAGTETGRVTGGDVVRVHLDRTTDTGYTFSLQLHFDRGNCTVTTPMAIRFVHPPEANRRLTKKAFDALADRFIEIANRRLNGWYAIRITGAEPGCAAPCRDQDMPIRVSVTRTNQPAASTVTLINEAGRSDAGTLYAKDASEWTIWHEAGHIALGASDEYPDTGRSEEHVNEGDWSIMASSGSFRGRAVLHPRHFSHILNWFKTEYPGCTVTIPALERSVVGDTIFRFETGLSLIGGQPGIYDSIVLEHGFPLDAARRLRLTLGGRFNYMMANDRTALLAGLTLGLEASTNRSSGGFSVGAETMIGGGLFGKTSNLLGGGTAAFEAGGHLGYAGRTLELGLSGRVGVPLSGPEAKNPYFILGLRFGVSF